MANRTDCIVIGAGLGGLSAACSLARMGKKVLLVEAHNVPGGYSTSFVRGRFEFEVALHELSGVGTRQSPGPMLDYLDWLGVGQDIEFVSPDHLYRSVFPGIDVNLPPGREAFEQTLIDAFPGESDGIHRFLERVFALDREASALERSFESGELRGLKLLSVPMKYPNALRHLGNTYADVLYREVADPGARGVLSQLWGYFGLPPTRASFFYFGLGLATYIRQGASYPKGRSQMLANVFVKALERHGGEIHLNTRVERILHRHGRVTGIVTERGREFSCETVVSNTDPMTTCTQLLGLPDEVRGYLNQARGMKIAPSTVNVYLGINRPPTELGLPDHETFVNVDLDIDAHHEGTHGIGRTQAIAVTNYSALWPGISPPGTSIVVLTALAYGEPWFRLRPEEYFDRKMETAQSMMKLAETIAPDLRKHVEVVEVSTPVTNARYAGTLGGSIYGFEHTPEASVIMRPPSPGPMRNLYFAGAWTQPGGGFQPCIMSGRMAANAIMARDGGVR